MITSEDLRLLRTIASKKTLAETARAFNVTPSSISQKVQQLEKKLNYKLIDRQARKARLTEEGEYLLKNGIQIVNELDNLNELINRKRGEMSGKIKVLAPLGFGNDYIAPLLAKFKVMYPSLRIELELSDQPDWSSLNVWDLMIYIGELKDSSLHLSVLARNQRFLCASPEYLEKNGMPKTPADLQKHNCIALRENKEDVTMWRFINIQSKKNESIRIDPHLSCNEGRVVKDWAISGMGIILRSEWDVAREINNGKLQRLLPNYELANADIVALSNTTQNNRSEKVIKLLDMLKDELKTKPWYSA